MDWQSLFDRLNRRTDDIVPNTDCECSHDDFIEEDGLDTCLDCGIIIRRKLCLSKPYSENALVKKIKSRCSILSDIPNEFDPTVKHLAVVIYKNVTAKKIFRCSLRKSILAACVHRASVWLKAPSDTCFTAFNLTNCEINKGVTFVACNLGIDEYNIPLYTIEEEMTKNCLKINIEPGKVISIYRKINEGCEELISSSQRKSIIFSCMWLYLKIFDKSRFVDIKAFSERASISSITVEKKYCMMMKYILSRVMKKIFYWCLLVLRRDQPWNYELRSRTPKIPVTLKNYRDYKLMTMIADDGFVYPLEDVDDVNDWNIVFKMSFDDDKTGTIVKIPIIVNCKLKNVSVSFGKCLKNEGPQTLQNAIMDFIT